MAPQSQSFLLHRRRCSSSSSSSSSLLIILSLICIYFFQSCNANKSNCIPSACGVIRNISFPFRLKDDPKNSCDLPRYELACENNVTSIYLNSQKYYVKEINYPNSSIRLVEASINNDDICSFPTFSVYARNFSRSRLSNGHFFGYPFSVLATLPINLMSCPNPLKNSSLFIDITNCDSSYPSRYSYIKVDRMYASNLTQGCRLEMITLTSWEFKDLNNISLSEIHLSLLYGFELNFCSECARPSSKWGFIRLKRGTESEINEVAKVQHRGAASTHAHASATTIRTKRRGGPNQLPPSRGCEARPRHLQQATAPTGVDKPRDRISGSSHPRLKLNLPASLPRPLRAPAPECPCRPRRGARTICASAPRITAVRSGKPALAAPEHAHSVRQRLFSSCPRRASGSPRIVESTLLLKPLFSSLFSSL